MFPNEWDSQKIMLQLSTSLLKTEAKIFSLKVFVNFKGRIHHWLHIMLITYGLKHAKKKKKMKQSLTRSPVVRLQVILCLLSQLSFFLLNTLIQLS